MFSRFLWAFYLVSVIINLTYAGSDYDYLIAHHNEKAKNTGMDIHQCNQEILVTLGGGRYGISHRPATLTERRNIVHALIDTALTQNDPAVMLPSLLAGIHANSCLAEAAYALNHLAVTTILYLAAIQSRSLDLNHRANGVQKDLTTFLLANQLPCSFADTLRLMQGKAREFLNLYEFESIYRMVAYYHDQTPGDIITLTPHTCVNYHSFPLNPNILHRRQDCLPITQPLYRELETPLKESFEKYITNNPDYEKAAYDIYLNKLRQHQFDQRQEVFPFPEEASRSLIDQEGNSLYEFDEDGGPYTRRHLYREEEQTFLTIQARYQELKRNFNPKKSAQDYSRALAAFYNTQIFHKRYIHNQINPHRIGQLRNLYNFCALDVDQGTLLIINFDSIGNEKVSKDLSRILQNLSHKRAVIRPFTGHGADFKELDSFNQLIFLDRNLTNVLNAWASLPGNYKVYSLWLEEAELFDLTLATEFSTHLSLLFHPFAFD